MFRALRIVPLEERIVLDAAVAAVVADAVASVAQSHAAPPIIYVDANSTGSTHDGTSWATAYTNLQSALDKAAATSGADQIWVAQGVYTPSKVYAPDNVVGGALGLSGDNMKTFNLPDNVEIYGGFKAGANNIAEQNPDHYLTILSGDLLGNDINDPLAAGYAASKADNAWHVVTAANDVSLTGVTARLDGLSIVNGYANGPEGSPFFTPVIANNYDYGGGMYVNFDSHIVLNDVAFKHNFAAGDGGGLFSNNSDLLVKDSTFDSNAAVARAGALEGWSAFDTKPHTMIITDSVFTNNTSAVFGGAIVGEGSFPSAGSKMIIHDSLFRDNVAGEGGAIVVDSLDVFVNDSKFIDNVAHVSGGAIATTNVVDTFLGGPINLTTTVADSTFEGNVAQGDLGYHAFMNGLFSNPPSLNIDFALGGGALANYMHGNMVVKDSLFKDNHAINSDGGAIMSGYGAALGDGFIIAAGLNTTVIDSVFVDNSAVNGGAIAAVSNVGYIAAPNLEANVIVVKDSVFKDNTALGVGGSMELKSVTADIKNNVFHNNNEAVGLGDQIYGDTSRINGVMSSSAGAVAAVKSYNTFKNFTLSEDLYLL